MTDDSKKVSTESAVPELEFGSSVMDLEIEKSGAVVTHSEGSSSSSEGIELSFGTDDSELSFGSSTPAPVEARTTKIETYSDTSDEISFSSSELEPEPEEENFVAVSEPAIAPDLQADLDSFKTTRKDYQAPKKETQGDIEFVAIEKANELSDTEHTMVLANAIAAATLNLTEVVKEFKVQHHVEEIVIEETEEKVEVQAEEVEYSSNVTDEEEFSFDEPSISKPEVEKTQPILKATSKKPVIKEVVEDEAYEPQVATSPRPATDLRVDVEMQATMRQMRDEREDILKQLKAAKTSARDLEQDNLTLKSALDESKIEISILRKRHFAELEDLKYRLSMSEDKKVLAEEKTRTLNSQKEKLEQKVRIDISQVRQREKELETKLEMLSIDVDSQVQSRDQKILELRRKIDSLEFNMENVSIREQKTSDDKRKIEDKLNKIMKTLRNSIKNLEEEVDTEIMSHRDTSIGKNK